MSHAIRLRFPATAVLIGLLVTTPNRGHAQAAGAGIRLELATAVAGAAQAFRDGLRDFDNVTPVAANVQFAKAIELDPSFGIARILHALTAVGMNPTDREAALQRGLADAAKGSSNELLAALAFRELARGQSPAANNLFRAAAAAMPGEATLAYRRAVTVLALPERNLADRLVAMRAFITTFPDFAPARNAIAYDLWRIDDRAGALREAREYVRLLPDHVNSHDSYAELLQWDGQFDQAIAHYRKAAELDPKSIAAPDGIAEAQLLMGRTDLARATLAAAASSLSFPGDPGAHRRIATTFLADGNAKAALAELALAAEAAKSAANPGLEALLHFQMAWVDQFLGDGKTTAAHAAAAGKLGTGGLVPQAAALEAAARRDWAAAHQAVQTAIRQANAAGNAAAAGNLEVTDALISVLEGRTEDAMAALGRGNTVSFPARMAMVLAARAKGDVGTAQAIGDEILALRQLALVNVNAGLARGIARGSALTGKKK